MFFALLLLFFISLSLLLLHLYITYQQAYECSKGIPGPKGLPILGNAMEFTDSKDILKKIMKYKEKYGKTFRVMLGTNILVITCEKEILEHFLSSYKYLNKNFMYRNWRNLLKDGLLLSTGNKWRARRKLITPTFHLKILEDFVEVFDRSANILVSKIRELVDEDQVDISERISLCTLDIICETAMGISINAQNKIDSKYVKSLHASMKIVVERSFSPIQSNDFLYFFTPNYWKERKVLNFIRSFTIDVLKRKRVESDKKFNDLKSNSNKKKRKAFLDMLLSATVDGQHLSDEDIQEEVNTFIFGGHETTSSAISFLLFALAENQDVQCKVFAEQKSLFSNKEEPVSYQNAQNMKYLEMVIKESLRFYPTVPLIAREIPEDEDIGGFTFPKGHSVVLFYYGSAWDSKYFPNPEKFDPERFSADSPIERSNFTYIPFSAGPRNCIGQKFAMIEMKTLISKLIRSFEILPSEPRHRVELCTETVLRSHNGIYVKLKERDWI